MPDDYILQWGNPALRMQARPIDVFDDLLRAQATRLCRTLECEDFQASLMQHEIDHLNGILTLHRAEPAERYRAISALLADEPAASHAA